MAKDERKNLRGFDSWKKRMDELADGVPTDDRYDEQLDEIIAQLERGDYSSLDPELCKEIEEREERERREKQKKIARPKEITP